MMEKLSASTNLIISKLGHQSKLMFLKKQKDNIIILIYKASSQTTVLYWEKEITGSLYP